MELVLIFAFAAIAGKETPENIGPFITNKTAIIEFMLKNELIDEYQKKNFINEYTYNMTHNTITMPYGDWLYIFALRNASRTLLEYSQYNIGLAYVKYDKTDIEFFPCVMTHQFVLAFHEPLKSHPAR